MVSLLETIKKEIKKPSHIVSVGINGTGFYSEFLEGLGKLYNILPVVYSLEHVTQNSKFKYEQKNIFEVNYPDNTLFLLPRPETYWGIDCFDQTKLCVYHSLMLKNNGVSTLLLFDVKVPIQHLNQQIYKQLGYPDITNIISKSTGNHMIIKFDK